MFNRLLLLSAAVLCPQLALGQFQVVQYESGDASLDLGGASDGQYWGVMWQEGSDVGTSNWNYVDMSDYPSACSAICGDSQVSYALGDTGYWVNICDEAWSCIPGDNFNCAINFFGNGVDDGYISFQGTTDSSDYGVGYSETSYCGGLVAL